jgi:hypothetical protein
VRHWLTGRVEAHLFICVLAAFVEWRLQEAWKSPTFADEEPPGPSSPPKPARRSKQSDLKASKRTRKDKTPPRPYGELLSHLATLTRNTVQMALPRAGRLSYTRLTQPTPAQTEAFRLLGTRTPDTLQAG